MKIRVLGAEVFHADRQTDMTKVIVAFHNFGNAIKICLKRSTIWCCRLDLSGSMWGSV